MATVTGDLTGLLPAPAAPSGRAGTRAAPFASGGASDPAGAATAGAVSDGPEARDFRTLLSRSLEAGGGSGRQGAGGEAGEPPRSTAGADEPVPEEPSGAEPQGASAESLPAAVLAALLALAGGGGPGAGVGGVPAADAAGMPPDPSRAAGPGVTAASGLAGPVAPAALGDGSQVGLPPSTSGRPAGEPSGGRAAPAGTAPPVPEQAEAASGRPSSESPLPAEASVRGGQALPLALDASARPASLPSRTAAVPATPESGRLPTGSGSDPGGGAAGRVLQPEGAPAAELPAPGTPAPGRRPGTAQGDPAAGGAAPAPGPAGTAAPGGLPEAAARGEQFGLHGPGGGHAAAGDMPGLAPAVYGPSPAVAEMAPAGAAQPGSSSGSAGMHDVSRQVADALREARLRAEGGETHLRVRLEPPHLGEVTVRLAVHEGTLRGEILVSRPEVRAALESQMEDLQQRLRQHGVNIGALSVGLSGGRSGGREAGAAPGSRPSRGWRRLTGAAAGPLAAVAGDPAARPRYYGMWLSGNRLDRLV